MPDLKKIIRPGAWFKINGTLQNITAIALDEPEGAAGAQLTVSFANPNASIPDTFNCEAKFGYYDSAGTLQGFVRFKETGMQRDLDFTVERLGDQLTLRLKDRIARLFEIAPTETIRYGDDPVTQPLTLIDAVVWLYGQIGLQAKVAGIPQVGIDPFEITPLQSFHEHGMRFVASFDPMIAVDTEHSQILFVGTDAAIDDVASSSSNKLHMGGSTVRTKPQIPYPIVTQAEIRYTGSGGGGDELESGCGLVGDGHSGIKRPGGALLVASSDLCGNARLSGEQIMGMLGDRVTQTTTVDREVLMPDGMTPDLFSANPLFLDLVPSEATVATTTTYYINFLNDEDEVERSVEYKTVQRQWAAAGEFLSNLVSETTNEIYFLPGVDLQYSTGHKTVTNARTDVPGAGTQFINNLLVEEEQIRLERWNVDGPGTWRKVAARRLTRGWALHPSGTPLHNANLNGTIDTANTTTETPVPDVLISQQTERISQGPLRNQIKTTVTTFNYLPKPGISQSTTVDTIGRQKLDGTREPLIHEIVRDDLATTWGGHRKRQVFDVTQWGDAGLDVGLWLADRAFGRVGQYRRPMTYTSPYVLAWAYRGMRLDLEERTEHNFMFVLGCSIQVTSLDTRTPAVSSSLSGIWLDSPTGTFTADFEA